MNTGINLTDDQKRTRRIENLMHDDFGGLTRQAATRLVDGHWSLEQAQAHSAAAKRVRASALRGPDGRLYTVPQD